MSLWDRRLSHIIYILSPFPERFNDFEKKRKQIRVMHILVGNPGKGRKEYGFCQSVYDCEK